MSYQAGRPGQNARELDPFDGILLVDKPSGMTSHDVVDRIRHTFRIRKVGHGGTLDPMATGLLIMLLGRGTRLSNDIMGTDKVYEGSMLFGTTTASEDADGVVTGTADYSAVTREAVESEMKKWLGDVQQIPPMVSAIKKDGVPLYKLARKGQVIEREERPVRVTGYQVMRIALPEIDFIVNCSKGFYVRTYAHDIGEKLGCGGHLSALRRTRSGKFTLERAVTVADLKTAPREDLLKAMVSLAEISLLRGA